MGVGQHIAHRASRGARVDKIVDDQQLLARRIGGDQIGIDRLEHRDLALALVIVGFDRDALDHPDIEFARNDCSGYQPATRDRNDRMEWALTGQTPGKRAGIAVKLIPGNRERLVLRVHT